MSFERCLLNDKYIFNFYTINVAYILQDKVKFLILNLSDLYNIEVSSKYGGYVSLLISSIRSCRSNVGKQVFARSYQIHTVLIGGGTDGKSLSRLFNRHLPEYNEYANIEDISRKITRLEQCHPESPRIIFGDKNNTSVVLYPGVISPLMHYILNSKDDIRSVEPLKKFKGSATFENIDREFTSLSSVIKCGDKVIVYITGHGFPFFGVRLWNKWVTRHFLTPKFLKAQLDKLPSNISVQLTVHSCFAGCYQQLSSSRVSVFTTSSETRVAQYCVHHIDDYNLLSLSDWGAANLLISFSSQNILNGNYYAMDSLTYFLKNQLTKNSIYFKTQKVFREVMNAMVKAIPLPNVSIMTGVAAILFIQVDPTGIFRQFYQVKVGVGVAKVTLPIVKVFIYSAIVRYFPKIQDSLSKSTAPLRGRFKQTYLYKNRYILYERWLLRNFLDEEIPKVTELSFDDQEKLEHIFAALKNLKEIRSNDEQFSHYYLLYDISLFFVKTAPIRKIRKFIEIAKPIVLSNRNIG